MASKSLIPQSCPKRESCKTNNEKIKTSTETTGVRPKTKQNTKIEKPTRPSASSAKNKQKPDKNHATHTGLLLSSNRTQPTRLLNFDIAGKTNSVELKSERRIKDSAPGESKHRNILNIPNPRVTRDLKKPIEVNTKNITQRSQGNIKKPLKEKTPLKSEAQVAVSKRYAAMSKQLSSKAFDENVKTIKRSKTQPVINLEHASKSQNETKIDGSNNLDELVDGSLSVNLEKSMTLSDIVSPTFKDALVEDLTLDGIALGKNCTTHSGIFFKSKRIKPAKLFKFNIANKKGDEELKSECNISVTITGESENNNIPNSVNSKVTGKLKSFKGKTNSTNQPDLINRRNHLKENVPIKSETPFLPKRCTIKTKQPSIKTLDKQVKNIRRSNTEPVLKLENSPSPGSKTEVLPTKDKTDLSDVKLNPKLEKESVALSDKSPTFKDRNNSPFEGITWTSPVELPHSGLNFRPKARKSILTFDVNKKLEQPTKVEPLDI